jgi:hypothetical protein
VLPVTPSGRLKPIFQNDEEYSVKHLHIVLRFAAGGTKSRFAGLPVTPSGRLKPIFQNDKNYSKQQLHSVLSFAAGVAKSRFAGLPVTPRNLGRHHPRAITKSVYKVTNFGIHSKVENLHFF